MKFRTFKPDGDLLHEHDINPGGSFCGTSWHEVVLTQDDFIRLMQLPPELLRRRIKIIASRNRPDPREN